MNLWPRRIITGLGLILILALIVWGIVAAVRAIAGAFSAGPTPQSTPQSVVQSGALDTSGYTLKGGQEATADGLLTDGTTIDVPACLDRDITATAKASSVASGSAMPVTLTLENRGSVACSTSLTRFNLAVTTGDQQVYDSSRCADSQQSSTTLLLRPGGTWSGALRWDGYVYANGCTAPAGGASAAAAGTYKVAVTMGTREDEDQSQAGDDASGPQVHGRTPTARRGFLGPTRPCPTPPLGGRDSGGRRRARRSSPTARCGSGGAVAGASGCGRGAPG